MKIKPIISPIVKTIFAAIDLAVFSALISVPIMQVLRARRKPIVAVAVYAAVFLTVCLLRVRMNRKKREREENHKKERERIERLLLMSDAEIGERIGEASFRLIRKAHPDAFDLLEALRKGARAVGVTECNPALNEVWNRYREGRNLIEGKELIRRVFHINESETRVKTPFGINLPDFVNRYFMLGSILFLCSFFVNFKIYFRLVSCLCLIIAPFAGIFRNQERYKNLRIFLDKRGDR